MCPPRACPVCKADFGYDPLTGECRLCEMQRLAQELYEIRVVRKDFPSNTQIPFEPNFFIHI